jgi:hypothetical protein
MASYVFPSACVTVAMLMATASHAQANAYGHQPGQGSAGNPGSVAATVNNLLGQGKHLVVVDGYLSEAPVWSPDQGSNGGRAGPAQCVGKSEHAAVVPRAKPGKANHFHRGALAKSSAENTRSSKT